MLQLYAQPASTQCNLSQHEHTMFGTNVIMHLSCSIAITKPFIGTEMILREFIYNSFTYNVPLNKLIL